MGLVGTPKSPKSHTRGPRALASAALSGLGWSLLRGGHLSEAAGAFGALLEGSPEDRLAPEAALTRAFALDQAKRTQMYQEANRQIMTILPGVPYAHSKPAIAFQANVSGYVPSPVDLQSFATVSIG